MTQPTKTRGRIPAYKLQQLTNTTLADLKVSPDHILGSDDEQLNFVINALVEARNLNCPRHTGFTTQLNALLRLMMSMDFVKQMIMDVGRQNEMVEAISAAGEENAASVEQISSFVHESVTAAEKATELASRGSALSEQTMRKINRSNEGILAAHARILEVNSRTKEIDSLTAIIKSVADQTNLLSLNASIEAARAGAAGKGFAVVADAIKRLSHSASESVAYISEHLNAMRAGIGSSADEIDTLSRDFSDCRNDVELLFGSVNDIHSSVKEINSNMLSIRASIEEQTAASEEMSSSLVVISEKSRQLERDCVKTGRGFYDISSKISEYRNELISLIDSMSDADAVDFCITDHLNWKWRVYNMLLGYDNIQLAEVGDHHSCRLGRWLETRGSENPALAAYIREINAPHERLHRLASEAVIAYGSRDTQTAEALLEQMDSVSKQIVAVLEQMKLKVK